MPRKMDFEGMVAKGENPNGFTAQTANGTAHATGTGWNSSKVPWWAMKRDPVSAPQLPPSGTRPASRGNRTGE